MLNSTRLMLKGERIPFRFHGFLQYKDANLSFALGLVLLRRRKQNSTLVTT